MRIGILASGGNSPGMNNAIITLTKAAMAYGYETVLISDGFKGLLEDKFRKIDIRLLEEFNCRGNVIIGSARSKEFYQMGSKRKAMEILKKHKVDVLVVIGGDGSYKGAAGLAKLGCKVMTLPGTIDNDVASSDSTIGFYTCLNRIVNSIDALRDSFDSHSGICFIEVMGREFSDLAIQAGVACEAEAIVTNDNIMNVEDFVQIANETWKHKKRSCIFVITENIYGKNDLPSLVDMAEDVEKQTGRTCRVSIVGHMQRGGTPDGMDRYWASMMAGHCIKCISVKKFNRAIGQSGGQLVDIDIQAAIKMPRKTNRMQTVTDYAKINRM